MIKKLFLWYEKAQQLAALKVEELQLRKDLFAKYFPAPKVGTNNHSLKDGYVLKGKYGMNYKVNEIALAQMLKKHPDMKEVVKAVIKYEPKVSVKEYKGLTDEQRRLLDNALIITPGTPGLEVVLPKRCQPTMPGK